MIKKAGTRITDRTAIKNMHAAGFTIDQISAKVSVQIPTVEAVISGAFDAREKERRAKAKGQAVVDAREEVDREAEKIAAIAAAAAEAVTKPKRKRRTKEEMEAAEETQQAE